MRPMLELIRGRPPVAVGPATTVRECCETMYRQRIGAVLVAEDGRLVGIFTGRDAVRCLANAVAAEVAVREVMTPAPVTVGPRQDSLDALRLMTDHGCRHLPVVSEAGEILGVVSRYDFRAREHRRLDDETVFFEVLR